MSKSTRFWRAQRRIDEAKAAVVAPEAAYRKAQKELGNAVALAMELEEKSTGLADGLVATARSLEFQARLKKEAAEAEFLRAQVRLDNAAQALRRLAPAPHGWTEVTA